MAHTPTGPTTYTLIYLSPRFIVSAVPIIDTASNILLQIFAACRHKVAEVTVKNLGPAKKLHTAGKLLKTPVAIHIHVLLPGRNMFEIVQEFTPIRQSLINLKEPRLLLGYY